MPGHIWWVSKKSPAKFPTRFPCPKIKKKLADELLQERREKISKRGNGASFAFRPLWSLHFAILPFQNEKMTLLNLLGKKKI